MTVLKTEGITKTFGKFQALDGIDMEVQKGEILGFIGPNGAGKSTTIRILLGILKASNGKAEIFGKDVWKDAVNIHEHIAYVPGDVNLWPNLTGGQVIDLFLKLRGDTNMEKRDELIQRFDLDPSKKCRTYSKGNLQKIALISALASDADLYILDEPTSGLDPLMEQTFQSYIKELRDAGKSILLSSHILSEVEQLCDRVTIIRQGEIIETGSLDEMRHLKRNQMYIETKHPITGLENVKGVQNVEKKNGGISLQADSDALDELTQHISKFGILKLESAPPTLEDLFIRHYQETDTTGETDGGVTDA